MQKEKNITVRCTDCLQTYKQLFIEEKWNCGDEQYRKDVLCLIAANIAIAMHVPFIDICFFEGAASNRGYILEDDYIYMNQDVLSNVSYVLDAIDTVLHEMRHKFQKEAVIFPQYYDVTEQTAEVWRKNFEHYIDSKWNFAVYLNQPVEKDAREFAQRIMECVLK